MRQVENQQQNGRFKLDYINNYLKGNGPNTPKKAEFVRQDKKQNPTDCLKCDRYIPQNIIYL